MKKFLLLILAVSSVFLSEAQWFQQNTPSSNSLRHLYFLDEQFGFTVGMNGTILKTTDGGDNWQLINSGVYSHLNAVQMTSYQTGYIVGNDGILLKTMNGGDNWTLMSSFTWNLIKDVHFLNDNVGFYCGQQQIIAKTTDGGLNWNLQDFGEYWLRALAFPTDNIGYCVGDAGHIHKTIDGGENWYSLNSGTTDHFMQVDFPSADTGYVTGIDGHILKTTDGGDNWQTIDAGTSDYLSGLSFLSNSVGYITGFENILFKTFDGGLSWESENLNCADTAIRLLMMDEETGYICGKNGLMLKRCQPPNSEFSNETTELTVDFTNLSSDFISCFWDFGDGYYSNLIDPTHTYYSPGIYSVCLISTNNCGTDSICKSVEVVTTNVYESNSTGIHVYPVPSDGNFKINCSQPHQIKEIIVRNSAGLFVSNIKWKTSHEELNVHLNLSSGIYFLDILMDDRRILEKIIITE